MTIFKIVVSNKNTLINGAADGLDWVKGERNVKSSWVLSPKVSLRGRSSLASHLWSELRI